MLLIESIHLIFRKKIPLIYIHIGSFFSHLIAIVRYGTDPNKTIAYQLKYQFNAKFINERCMFMFIDSNVWRILFIWCDDYQIETFHHPRNGQLAYCATIWTIQWTYTSKRLDYAYKRTCQPASSMVVESKILHSELHVCCYCCCSTFEIYVFFFQIDDWILMHNPTACFITELNIQQIDLNTKTDYTPSM